VIVSIASLFIAWRQSTVMERQLAASVWPSLEYQTGNIEDGKPIIDMIIHNGGIGPARIRSFELSYEGAPVKDASELLATCCGKVEDDFPMMTSPLIGRILPAGGNVTFLSLERTAKTEAQWEKLNRARFRVEGSICYCSALEACWSARVPQGDPESVPSCAVAARRRQYH
jgi:hypothetical protein